MNWTQALILNLFGFQRVPFYSPRIRNNTKKILSNKIRTNPYNVVRYTSDRNALDRLIRLTCPRPSVILIDQRKRKRFWRCKHFSSLDRMIIVGTTFGTSVTRNTQRIHRPLPALKKKKKNGTKKCKYCRWQQEIFSRDMFRPTFCPEQTFPFYFLFCFYPTPTQSLPILLLSYSSITTEPLGDSTKRKRKKAERKI